MKLTTLILDRTTKKGTGKIVIGEEGPYSFFHSSSGKEGTNKTQTLFFTMECLGEKEIARVIGIGSHNSIKSIVGKCV